MWDFMEKDLNEVSEIVSLFIEVSLSFFLFSFSLFSLFSLSSIFFSFSFSLSLFSLFFLFHFLSFSFFSFLFFYAGHELERIAAFSNKNAKPGFFSLNFFLTIFFYYFSFFFSLFSPPSLSSLLSLSLSQFPGAKVLRSRGDFQETMREEEKQYVVISTVVPENSGWEDEN